MANGVVSELHTLRCGVHGDKDAWTHAGHIAVVVVDMCATDLGSPRTCHGCDPSTGSVELTHPIFVSCQMSHKAIMLRFGKSSKDN